MKKAKTTLYRVMSLIGGWGLLYLLAGGVVHIWYSYSYPAYAMGCFIGTGMSELLMLHRFHTIDLELNLPRKKAVTHARISGGIRGVLLLAVLFLAFRFPAVFSPVGTIFGCFSTKLAVWTYPVIFQESDPGKSSLKESGLEEPDPGEGRELEERMNLEEKTERKEE